jgi:nucleotide-binding universal stress UspA family protein
MTERFKVLHASSYEAADRSIFAHAAAIALASRGDLVSLHANDGEEGEKPNLDATLAGWGAAPSFKYERIDHNCCDDPVDTLLDGIRAARPNLIVTGSHGKHGWQLLSEGSVSQAVVANADAPVLVLPIGGRGMVDETTGILGLRRVLVPVEDDSMSDAAMEAIVDLFERLDVDDLDIYLLHVGEGDALDSSLFPEHDGWRGHRLQREGLLSDAILEVCTEQGIDLVVMPTRGANSLRDIFLGTNTEQALQQAVCPLLALPAH